MQLEMVKIIPRRKSENSLRFIRNQVNLQTLNDQQIGKLFCSIQTSDGCSNNNFLSLGRSTASPDCPVSSDEDEDDEAIRRSRKTRKCCWRGKKVLSLLVALEIN